MTAKLRPEFQHAIIQEQERWWPDKVPSFIELRDAHGRHPRYLPRSELTPQLARQAMIGHIAAAVRAIRKGSVKGAAYHIVRARLYRCDLFQDDQEAARYGEEAMPFARMTWDGPEAILAGLAGLPAESGNGQKSA